MTMTKIPSRNAWYTYGHGPLILLLHMMARQKKTFRTNAVQSPREDFQRENQGDTERVGGRVSNSLRTSTRFFRTTPPFLRSHGRPATE